MGANDIQHGGDHYKGAKFQHWDLCSKNHIGYLESCGAKYASRWRKKNGAEDLEKGVHFCDKILEVITEFNYRPTGCASMEDLARFFNENGITDTHERAAITFLCCWADEDDIQNARRNMVSLLEKARALA